MSEIGEGPTQERPVLLDDKAEEKMEAFVEALESQRSGRSILKLNLAKEERDLESLSFKEKMIFSGRYAATLQWEFLESFGRFLVPRQASKRDAVSCLPRERIRKTRTLLPPCQEKYVSTFSVNILQ